MNRLAVTLAAATLLSACTTVELPNLGVNLPEFKDSIQDLQKAYPQANELPERPTDVRSAAEWDASAEEMLRLREGFDAPALEPGLSEPAFDAEFERARDLATAYQDDDPQ